MDLKAFYRKIQEIERTIADDFVVVMSNETSDGGRADVPSEVSRRVASKMIVERRARLASEKETLAFKEAQNAARVRAEEERVAKKVHIAILPESQLHSKKPTRKSES